MEYTFWHYKVMIKPSALQVAKTLTLIYTDKME